MSVCGDLLDKVASISSTPAAANTIAEEPNTGQKNINIANSVKLFPEYVDIIIALVLITANN